jgi:hypothetical protein
MGMGPGVSWLPLRVHAEIIKIATYVQNNFGLCDLF